MAQCEGLYVMHVYIGRVVLPNEVRLKSKLVSCLIRGLSLKLNNCEQKVFAKRYQTIDIINALLLGITQRLLFKR
jgi:hypothetical protein